jgi:hypothetical protein
MNTKLDDALDAACRVMFGGFCVVTMPIDWLDDRIGPIPTVIAGTGIAIAATYGLEFGLHELHRHLQSYLDASDSLR